MSISSVASSHCSPDLPLIITCSSAWQFTNVRTGERSSVRDRECQLLGVAPGLTLFEIAV